MSENCPDLEVLFTELLEGGGPAVEHSKTCRACAAVVAEHRSLEHDLFKLSDPMPPSGFVPGVMARIATAPAPVRRELWTGLTVLVASVGASAAALFARPDALGRIGVAAANTAHQGVSLATALPGGLSVLWHHAALPGGAFCILLLGSLYGLKKLAGSPALSDQRANA